MELDATAFADLGGVAASLGVLLAALGLSSTAGLRAYLPLLAVGIAGDANVVPLQSSFTGLGSPALLLLLAVLAFGEFVADKVPILDHLSDFVHTAIRPAAGALIMVGTHNSLSDANMGLAALVGAGLALLIHGAKATARPAISASTAGIGNPVVSTVEDIIVIFLLILLLTLPILGLAALALLTAFLLRIAQRLTRRLRGRRSGAGLTERAITRSDRFPADAPTLPGGR